MREIKRINKHHQMGGTSTAVSRFKTNPSSANNTKKAINPKNDNRPIRILKARYGISLADGCN